jgi:uncharacterized membrane protein AbrB (regulator of aidB expression)
LERHRPQHYHPAARFVAWLCSVATLVSLGFHFRQEKLGALYKNVIISLFLYFLTRLAMYV